MTELGYDAGADAERLVNRLLRREGWLTSPAHGVEPSEDKAPMFVGESSKLIMPDIYAMRAGTAIWVEVKQFGKAVPTRKRGQLEHGVRTRKFDAYQQTRERSGLAVWLMIFEEDTGELIAVEIDDLTALPPVSRERCIAEYGELVSYFPKRDFSAVSVSDADVPANFPHAVELDNGTPIQNLIQAHEMAAEDREKLSAYTDGGENR